MIMNKRINIMIGLLMFVAFSIASLITFFWQLFFVFYIIAMAVVIWFIIKILRYPTTSNRTFDKYFYDDLNIKFMEEKKLKKAR